ncbi:PglD-related sugar-binding protein [Myroides sp. LJL115]
MKKVLVYGNGGHGKVVADAIRQNKQECLIEFIDDATNPYDSQYEPNASLVIAVGNNEVRKQIATKIKHKFDIVIHPKAYVSELAEIGEGTVILANAVVQAGAKIGKHCIINANVTIDHDAIVGDYVCTYPGSYVAGFAIVKQCSILNPGKVVWKGEVFGN